MDGRVREAPDALRRLLGAACHHCPLCVYGRRRPESWIGRILHHRWHADHCPFWKAEQELYQPDRRNR